MLGLPYTHVLCVNKCLQFYIEDELSVRVSNCIFFTFIDFKTDPLYVFGAMISFMASNWYCELFMVIKSAEKSY